MSFRLLSLVSVAALIACGDDAQPKSTPDTPDVYIPDDVPDVAPDTTQPDTTQPDTNPPEVGPPPANQLGYAPDMVGSDGLACVAGCAVKRQTGEGLELAVVYKDADGRPIVDRTVYWDAGSAPADLASLGAMSTYTDAQGRAQVSLRSGGLTGSLTVTAQVLGDETVAPLTFAVTYEPPPHPDLVVSFEYLGQHPVAELTLRLFRQHEAGPTCASVHPDAAPAAPELTLGPAAIGRQIRVQTLPGLATDHSQRWVVQLIGPHTNDQGAPLVVGCLDDVQATQGSTAQAYVYVLDLPPHLRGTYQSVTRIDSLSGGEGTAIGDMLLMLTEVFTHPGRLAVVWACANSPAGVLGTVCGWITNSSGQPSSILGAIVVDLIDDAMLALLAEVVGENFQSASQAISEVLRDLRLVAEMSFADEPSSPRDGFPGAYFAPGGAAEVWTHVRFRWKHDARCKNTPNPTDCGWDQIPLEQVYGHRPTADLDAGVDAALALHITPHAVADLTYGPLINHLVERRIMPLVFAEGTTAPVDSWDDLVATLFGDRFCLTENDCCDWFAFKTEDSLGAFFSSETRRTACELAIPIVANVVRNRITGLNGALHLGTFADHPCASRDADNDRWIDGYGTQANTCDWDLWFPTSGQRFKPDNDWLSVRH